MTYNRICAYCGDKYYVCKKCISINSTKNVCCSLACYRNLIAENKDMRPLVLENGVNHMPVILRAGLASGKTIDITGYDLEQGKFDCADNVTRTFKEFSYFIIPTEEMSDISKRLNSKIEATKEKSKPVAKREPIVEEIEEYEKVSEVKEDKPEETPRQNRRNNKFYEN